MAALQYHCMSVQSLWPLLNSWGVNGLGVVVSCRGFFFSRSYFFIYWFFSSFLGRHASFAWLILFFHCQCYWGKWANWEKHCREYTAGTRKFMVNGHNHKLLIWRWQSRQCRSWKQECCSSARWVSFTSSWAYRLGLKRSSSHQLESAGKQKGNQCMYGERCQRPLFSVASFVVKGVRLQYKRFNGTLSTGSLAQHNRVNMSAVLNRKNKDPYWCCTHT